MHDALSESREALLDAVLGVSLVLATLALPLAFLILLGQRGLWMVLLAETCAYEHSLRSICRPWRLGLSQRPRLRPQRGRAPT